MANRTKIVFLGATRMSFGLRMLRDIFASDELHGSTLTLVGRNPATLAKMTELADQASSTIWHRAHYRSLHSFRCELAGIHPISHGPYPIRSQSSSASR